jgi:protein-tyrosine phosphatase
MMSEIIDNLFIGDQQDAAQAPLTMWIVNVLEGHAPEQRGMLMWLPILPPGGPPAERAMLDAAITHIDRLLGMGHKVLVHCGAGVERSPLTVAWYLREKSGMDWDQAYALLREKRPVVQDRREWAPFSKDIAP